MHSNPLNQHKSRQYSLLAILALIWGSSFIFMKKGLQTFSYQEVAYLRMVSASVVLIPIALMHWRKLNTKNIWVFGLSGLLGNGIPAILFTTAQTQISSSLAGMLNAFVPLLTILVGATFFKVPMKSKYWLGVILGLIGVLGLLYFKQNTSSSSNQWYGLLVILAAICYAFNVNLIKKHLQGFSGVEIASLVFVVMSPIFWILLFSTDFTSKIVHPNDWINTGLIVVLGVVGTAIATILFNNLLRVTSAVFASSVTYLIPVVAMCWGMLDGENIIREQILSITLILIGVYYINRTPKKAVER